MAYEFEKSNGGIVQVSDNQIDDTQFSIPLVGRNFKGYAPSIAKSLVKILENFAHDQAPNNPTLGQLWYDTTGLSQVPPTPAVLKVCSAAAVVGVSPAEWTPLTWNENGDILPLIPGVSNIGSPTAQFNIMYGTATSAQYADLAERYASDEPLEPGTVVNIGGIAQVTKSKEYADTEVFGVVSTQPGLMLNSTVGDSKTHPYIALTGQVPVKVIGPVRKGQRLIASEIPGVAQGISTDDYITPLAIIGRSLVDCAQQDQRKILAVVGVK